MNVDAPAIFYGAASGQQRSALRRLEPEAVMISFATKHNSPIEGEYDLFVDSGGYHQMITGSGEYDSSIAEYYEYLRDVQPELWALRDYPCEPELLESLGRSVRDHQRRTTEAAMEMLPRAGDVPGQPVTVIQGWTEEQYLRHLDVLESRGVLTGYVGVGSVCRRGADLEIADILLAVRDALPSRCKLHAFGVKGSALQYQEVSEAVDSVDSGAYDWSVSRVPDQRTDGESFTWRDCARAYLNWRHETLSKVGTRRLDAQATHVQQELPTQ